MHTSTVYSVKKEMTENATEVDYFDMKFTAAPAFESVCFQLFDNDKKILDTVKIKTLLIEEVCEEQLLYYIPKSISLDTRIESKCTVWGMSVSNWCGEDNCAVANKKIAEEIFTNKHKNWLANYGCDTECSGYSCKCAFATSTACLWWRIFYKNDEKKAFPVYTCNVWKYKYLFEITSHNLVTKAVLELGESLKLNTVNNFVISSDLIATNRYNFLSYCFLKTNENEYYMMDCNKYGSMKIGLGDVQCKSKTSAGENDSGMLTTDCSMNKDLVSVDAYSSTRVFRYNGFDSNKLTNMSHLKLPIKTGEYEILHENSSIVLKNFGHNNVLLSISSKYVQKIKSFSQHKKCQFLGFEKISGCYDCAMGFNISIIVKVNESFVADVVCNDEKHHLHSSVILQKNIIYANVSSLRSNVKNVSLSCNLVCDNVEHFYVNGILNDPQLKQTNNLYSAFSVLKHDTLSNQTSIEFFSWPIISTFSIPLFGVFCLVIFLIFLVKCMQKQKGYNYSAIIKTV